MICQGASKEIPTVTQRGGHRGVQSATRWWQPGCPPYNKGGGSSSGGVGHSTRVGYRSTSLMWYPVGEGSRRGHHRGPQFAKFWALNKKSAGTEKSAGELKSPQQSTAGEGASGGKGDGSEESVPFILGEALPVIPAKLVNRREFVDMSDLLKDNLQAATLRRMGPAARHLLNPHVTREKSKTC
jgi:hypothetical protein